MDPERFCRMMAASYAGRRDLEMTPARIAHVREFQDRYRALPAPGHGKAMKTL